jgi:hypothetical protein
MEQSRPQTSPTSPRVRTEMTFGFHVADHGLDGGSTSQFAFARQKLSRWLAYSPNHPPTQGRIMSSFFAHPSGFGIQG